MENKEDKLWLYGKFVDAGLEIGTYEDFDHSLQNDEDKQWYYNKASQLGLNIGTYDEFNKEFGYKPREVKPSNKEYPINDIRNPKNPMHFPDTLTIPGEYEPSPAAPQKPQRRNFYDYLSNALGRNVETPSAAPQTEATVDPSLRYKSTSTGDLPQELKDAGLNAKDVAFQWGGGQSGAGYYTLTPEQAEKVNLFRQKVDRYKTMFSGPAETESEDGSDLSEFVDATPKKEVKTNFFEGLKQAGAGVLGGVMNAAGENANAIRTAIYGDEADTFLWKDAAAEVSRREKAGEPLFQSNQRLTSAQRSVLSKEEWRAEERKNEVNDFINRLRDKAKDEGKNPDEEVKRLMESYSSGGDVVTSLSKKGSEIIENNSAELKGAAKVGALGPMILSSGASVALAAAGQQQAAKTFADLTLGMFAASSAGSTMKQAREAGATNAQVMTAGLSSAAIMYRFSKIPLNRYIQRAGASAAANAAANSAGEGAARELDKLLSDAAKRGILTSANAKQYIAELGKRWAGDIASHTASFAAMGGAEALVPLIYEDPEKYPVLKNVLDSAISGAEDGLMMGVLMGGVTNGLDLYQRNARWRRNGSAYFAEVESSGGDVYFILDKDTKSWRPLTETESFPEGLNFAELVKADRSHGGDTSMGLVELQAVDGNLYLAEPSVIKSAMKVDWKKASEQSREAYRDSGYEAGESAETPEQKTDLSIDRDYQQRKALKESNDTGSVSETTQLDVDRADAAMEGRRNAMRTKMEQQIGRPFYKNAETPGQETVDVLELNDDRVVFVIGEDEKGIVFIDKEGKTGMIDKDSENIFQRYQESLNEYLDAQVLYEDQIIEQERMADEQAGNIAALQKRVQQEKRINLGTPEQEVWGVIVGINPNIDGGVTVQVEGEPNPRFLNWKDVSSSLNMPLEPKSNEDIVTDRMKTDAAIDSYNKNIPSGADLQVRMDDGTTETYKFRGAELVDGDIIIRAADAQTGAVVDLVPEMVSNLDALMRGENSSSVSGINAVNELQNLVVPNNNNISDEYVGLGKVEQDGPNTHFFLKDNPAEAKRTRLTIRNIANRAQTYEEFIDGLRARGWYITSSQAQLGGWLKDRFEAYKRGEMTLDQFADYFVPEEYRETVTRPATETGQAVQVFDDPVANEMGIDPKYAFTTESGQVVVDGRALWNDNPEQWAEWNDRNPNRGISTMEFLTDKQQKIHDEAKAALDAYKDEWKGNQDPNVLNGLKEELDKKVERMQRVDELVKKYEEAQKIADAKIEAAAASAEPVENIPAAPAEVTQEVPAAPVQEEIPAPVAQEAVPESAPVPAEPAPVAAEPVAEVPAPAAPEVTEAQEQTLSMLGTTPKQAAMDVAQGKLDEISARNTDDLPRTRKVELMREKAGVLQEMFDRMGVENTIVSTREDILGQYKRDGASDSDIALVEFQLERTERKKQRMRGFYSHGKVYLIADDIVSASDASLSNVHEHKHLENRTTGAPMESLKTGITKEELGDAIFYLTKVDTYTDDDIVSLADELLANAAEIAEISGTESIPEELRKAGIKNEDFINFVQKNIKNGRQGSQPLSEQRRNPLQSDDSKVNGGQNVGNPAAGSGALEGQLGSVVGGGTSVGGGEESPAARDLSFRVGENATPEEIRLNYAGIAANPDESRQSVRYAPTEEQAKQIVSDIVKETGVPEKKAKDWVESETSLAAIILDEVNSPYLNYVADDRYTAIKSDSDYPQGTVDFNNICRKRVPFTDMYQRIQQAFPNTIITGQDLAVIRQIMKDDGQTVACGLCYVEDRRQLLGEIARNFIEEMKGNFENYAKGGETKEKNAEKFRNLLGDDRKEDLSIYDLLTLDGSQKLYNEHRGIYDAFQAFNKARGQQSGNLFQGYAEYKREILKWTPAKVASVNGHGGLRIFSYSDFEAHHLIDLVQIVQDCARKGVMIQGYTKVPAFARAIADTGIKINRSLIPLGDTGIVDGKLAYDPVEGIDINDPDFLESNDNVGNILIGINDEQISMAMVDPFIHYIIPYHSNQSGILRKMKQTGAWTNYKNEQLEKGGKEINIYTDVLAAAESEGKPIKNEKQFVKKFLEVCKERGLKPRFARFLNVDEKGDYAYRAGYYKLLVDFKLFDENGKILPQKPVVPKFDNDFNAQILRDYVADEKAKMGDELDGVYKEIVEKLGLDDRGPDIHFSVTNRKNDIFVSNAAKAVDGITMEKATPEQWMKMIEKNGGLKAGEDKWIGLSDWLQKSDRKSLSKQEVSDFIEQNRIRLEEVSYGKLEETDRFKELNEEYKDLVGRDAERIEALQNELDEFRAQMTEKYGQDYDYSQLTRGEEHNETQLIGMIELWEESPREAAFEEMIDRYGDDFNIAFDFVGVQEGTDPGLYVNNTEATEYFVGEKGINSLRKSYTTEGLENKKEIALTVPTIEPWNESDKIHFGDAGEGRAISWIRFGDAEYNPSYDEAQKASKEYQEYIREKYKDGDTYHYSEITDEENEKLMALHVAAKKAKDGGKQKVLFIDEIQSKRHQEGRERGYVDAPNIKELEQKWRDASKAYDDYVDSIKEKYGDLKSIHDNITDEENQRLIDLNDASIEAANAVDRAKGGIPAAPFEKNWHELSLKRMLRYAAEKGYDYVAWTTGEQQAERYNIGDRVSHIGVYPTIDEQHPNERIVNIHLLHSGGDFINLVVDDNGIVTHGHYQTDHFEGKALSDLIGKELSSKVMAATEEVEFSGNDFRIGGEGMKGFYDKILPTYMNKYGKRWGVKVGDIELPIGEAGALTAHSVPVTKEMKESVMGGQPMFSIHGREVRYPESVSQEQRDVVEKNLTDYTNIESDRYKQAKKLAEDVASRIESENEAKYGDTKREIERIDNRLKELNSGKGRIFSEGLSRDGLPAIKAEEQTLKAQKSALQSTIKSINPFSFDAKKQKDKAILDAGILDNSEWKEVAVVPSFEPEVRNELMRMGWNGLDNTAYATEYGFVSHWLAHHPDMTETEVTADMLQNLYEPDVVGFDPRFEDTILFIRNGGGVWYTTAVKVNPFKNDGSLLFATTYKNKENPSKKLARTISLGHLNGAAASNQIHRSFDDLAANIGINSDSAIDFEDFSRENAEETGGASFSIVSDPAKIEELEKGNKVRVYRSMQLIDGKLYPPMSAMVNGELRDPIELGVWEQADEHPELADENGDFLLEKGDGSEPMKVAYAPYIHTRRSPLNEQFSSAYKRPNLVIVESEIPESELAGGYTANRSKKSTGEHDWPSGKISNALANQGDDTRKVILSRWSKPIRIVPNSEVADIIAKKIEGKNLSFPYNVVTPGLREELSKRGVRFEGWQGNKPNNVDEIIAGMQRSDNVVDYLFNGRETISPTLRPAVQKLNDDGITIDDESILKDYGLSNLTLSKKSDVVTIDKLVVADRNQGNGTRFMDDLTKEADGNNWTLALTPDASFGATSVRRLKDFYKRFGFKENKGRNTDFTINESMVRRPNDGTKFSITAEQDKDYLAAVKDGNEEKAREMVAAAAKRAMPNTKVVDEAGNPLVVYHGGSFGQVVENPLEEYGVLNTNVWDAEDSNGWFSSSKQYSRVYVRDFDQEPIEAYLDIKNPFAMGDTMQDIVSEGKPTALAEDYAKRLGVGVDDILGLIQDEFADEATMDGKVIYARAFTINRNPDFARLLESKGYDGAMDIEADGSVGYMVTRPNQIKSAAPVTREDNGDVIPLSKRFSGSDDIRFSIAYHGSPNSFDRFDHSHMGEGEGHQAHGWGTYVAMKKDTAKRYAYLAERDSVTYDGPDFPTYYAKELVGSMVLEYQQKGTPFSESRARMLKMLEDIENERKAGNVSNYWKNHSVEKEIDFLRGISDDNFEIKEVNRNIYDLEIPDDDGHNYIDEGKNLRKPERMRIVEALRSLPEGIWKISEDEANLFRDKTAGMLADRLEKRPMSGGDIYAELVHGLGSKKDASMFLSNAGFVGIKYDGRVDGECAVIFNEDDVRIADRARFSVQGMDEEYRKAVDDDDMDAAQEMVDKAAEEAGYTIRGYHGTTHDFYIFDRRKGNAERNWGKGFYFTNNYDDASANYGNEVGPDLTHRVEMLAENMDWMDGYEDLSYEERLEEARKMLVGDNPHVVNAALRMENPLIIDSSFASNETYFDLDYGYNEETDEYEGEPTGLLMDFINAWNAEMDEWEWDGYQVSPDRILEDAYDGYTASQLERKAREILDEAGIQNSEGQLASGEFLRAVFERMGFDGIVDNNVNAKFGTQRRFGRAMDGMGMGTTHFIVFDSSQIKQTDPVTYDDNGEVIPLSKRFNSDKQDIRFSVANRENEIFVSNAQKAVEDIKMDKATPEQWLKMIEKGGGLKAGEDKWIGLSDWLKQQDRKTLTKQEVADYIAQNRIQIEEVHYSENGQLSDQELDDIYNYGLPPKLDDFHSKLQGEFDDLLESMDAYDAYEKMAEKYGDRFREAYDKDDCVSEESLQWTYVGPLMELAGMANGGENSNDRAINPTRLSYTTIGLKDKREIALTVPTIDPWKASDDIHFGDAGEGRAVAWIRFGESWASRAREDAEKVYKDAFKAYIDYKNELTRKYALKATGTKTVKDIATEEENARLKELYLESTNKYRDWQYGNHPKEKVLVIDEIQSKRHQEGREKGYIDESKISVVENGDGWDYSYDGGSSGYVSKLIAPTEKIARSYAKQFVGKSVPSAPFEKNWYELSMKRMLRLAAEEGYDAIAWTTGEQQAERYDLSVYISKIEVKKHPAADDLYQVTSYYADGAAMTTGSGIYDKQQLREIFGKDLAVNIVTSAEDAAGDVATIEEDNLRIGGEGMKGFYDDILPRFMNKYGKKWGVSVKDLFLPKLGETGNGLTMHSVPVTEEMKASVMEGQPMFSLRGIVGAANDAAAMANLDVAKEMEESGKDAKTIWAATGWEKGADGKWRNEIKDAKSKVMDKGHRKYVVSDIVDAPELFQSYPELKDYKVSFKKMKAAAGEYKEKVITLDPDDTLSYRMSEEQKNELLDRIRKNVHENGMTARDTKKDAADWTKKNGELILSENGLTIMLHELQHAIQYIEGFARGGSVSGQRIELLRDSLKDDPVAGAFAAYFSGNNPKNKLFRVGKDAVLHAVDRSLLNNQYPDEESRKYARMLRDYLETCSPAQYMNLVYKGDKIFKDAKDNAIDSYRKLSGEVEARNVTDRMKLSEEERRSTPPSATEDYPRSEQNVRFKSRKSAVEAFDKGGLGAVVGGDDIVDGIYGQVYRTLPKSILSPIVDKAMKSGLDFRSEIRSYVHDLAQAGPQNDGTGLLRALYDEIRALSGSPDLSENDIRYMLWKSTGNDGGDILSMAQDIAMKRRWQKEDEQRFSVRKDLTDVVEDSKEKLDERLADAADDLEEAKETVPYLKDVLNPVVAAMSSQKAYDRATVDGIVRFAKDIIRNGGVDSFTTREANRLLTLVNSSTGKSATYVTRYADQLLDYLLDHIVKSERGKFEKLVNIKDVKTNQSGVAAVGSLDVSGQITMRALRDYMLRPQEEIENRIAEVENKFESEDEKVREDARAEYEGLKLASDYQRDLEENIKEGNDLENELDEAKEAKRTGDFPAKDYAEFAKVTGEAIRKNKIERVDLYRDFQERLAELQKGSKVRARAFRQAEKERVENIHHLANLDMQGTPNREHLEPTAKSRLLNSNGVRFFLKPLATFDQMLRLFGRSTVTGEGYLYNHFGRGWVEAREKELVGKEEAMAELDKKVQEVFGDKKMKWSKLYDMERKMTGATVSFMDGGEKVAHDLTPGNLLYIYMVNKMVDGKMKLRKMGITEEDVQNIQRSLDPEFIQLADWLQEEFLPKRRAKYNAVHEELFGASMAAIDDYFPLKILSNARVENIDLGDNPEASTLSSTTTGSIVKRRKNSLALDLLNTDAFSLAVEHIEEMENWAAFAPFRKDMNTLLSYKRFRNQVQNMDTVYGSGKDLWNNFKDVASIATGNYRPKVGKRDIDTVALNVAKGVTGAKIAFRIGTALKQILSAPAFLSDARIDLLAKNLATAPLAWNWCMDNLPVFRERWNSRFAGDTRLMQTESDWELWKNKVVKQAGKYGMSPNAFVDALTVAVGAKSMYETKYQRYIDAGYPEEKADKMAKQDATILYNQTQQSSEAMFTSAMQLDRTLGAVLFTTFRNSSMGYSRQTHDALRTYGRMMQEGYRERAIERMKRQRMEDGLGEDDARNYAEKEYDRQRWRSAARIGIFAFLLPLAWNYGIGDLMYILFGKDEKEKKKIHHDALVHTLAGPVEGLTGGSVISSAWGTYSSTGKTANIGLAELPIESDLDKIVSMLDYDEPAAVAEVINLIVQSGVGLNPQTFTDAMVATIDAFNGDLGLAKEFAIWLMRVNQLPQPSVEKFLLDEINMTPDEMKAARVDELAARYAEYKLNKAAPLNRWMYDEGLEAKRRKSYQTKFKNKVKERNKLQEAK